MYQIIVNNEIIGCVEHPTFIRINPKNGCFNSCDRKDAVGIVYCGKNYNLFNTDGIGETETAYVREVDSADVVEADRIAVEQSMTDMYLDMVEMGQQVTDLYLDVIGGNTSDV